VKERSATVKVHSVRVADWLWVARNGHCHFGEN
jgi:hypothetical protein